MEKGFTLIELLVVIAIVAVLSAAVILTLNPAQLLAQTRDSNRLSDLATIKSAMALYLVDVSGITTIADASSSLRCYVSTNVGGQGVTNCGGRFTGSGASSSSTTPAAINGTGWVGNSPAAGLGPDLSQITGGSPISAWPLDPTNNATYFYAYAANNGQLTYELNANMESAKYQNGGPNDVEINTVDGGSDNALYEVGTSSGLAL